MVISIKNRRILASMLFVCILLSIFLTNILFTNLPMANLAATFPSLPSWVLTMIQGILSAGTTIGTLAAILGTYGLASIASLAFQYVKTYGVKMGIAL